MHASTSDFPNVPCSKETCRGQGAGLQPAITASNQDLDIDKDEAPLEAWLKANCQKYYFAVERGGVLSQLHWQGVVRLVISCSQVLTKRLKEDVGFNSPDVVDHKVMSRELTGKGLHTWEGLIGYCSKDLGLMPCKVLQEGISDDDLKVGRELPVHYGASEEMKNRVVLTSHNIFTRAAMFHKFMSRHPLGASFAQTMVEMHRTGKYIPDAKWLIPTAGRGMVAARAEAAWMMFLQPDMVTRSDINLVYFQEAQSLRDEPLTFVHCC